MLQHPTWMYQGQEARLFKAGEIVPEGWSDAPSQPYAAEGEDTPLAPLLGDAPIKRGPGRPRKVVE